jgi:hypothetical protein
MVKPKSESDQNGKSLKSLIETRACEMLRRAQTASGISQKALGHELERRTGQRWPQSRVWKLLWCQMPTTIPMYEVVAEALGLSFRDLVTNSSEGYLRHLSPDEWRLIEILRRRGDASTAALVSVLAPREKPRKTKS